MLPGRNIRFTTTRWTLVRAAAASPTPQSKAAMEELCRIYREPLLGFAARLLGSATEAEDATHDFIVHALEHGVFARASAEKGMFRTFIRASLRHFLANQYKERMAQKRGGGKKAVSIDSDSFSSSDDRSLCCAPDLDVAFDREWALALLRKAAIEANRLLKTPEDRLLLAALVPELGIKDLGEVPQGDLATHLEISEGALKVRKCRMRKVLRDQIRAAVEETVASCQDIDAELSYLFTCLKA